MVDKALHAKRTVIERLIRRLQECRWLATRYETYARCYLAGASSGDASANSVFQTRPKTYGTDACST